MIRLSWRQLKGQVAFCTAALVVVAIVAAITGPHLVHLYDTSVTTCAAHGDCSTATTAFLENDATLRSWLGILVVVLPGIIGIFWGAPLIARELEAGTHRLIWTQSVTRTRWLVVKLGVAGLASVIVAGGLSLIVSWWAGPLDGAKASVFSTFDQRDIVPIGYAAFALALGVTAGLLIRRTVPAMAATLVAFVATLVAVAHWVRPHLVTPRIRTYGLNSSTTGFGSANGSPFSLQPNPPNIPNSWIYSERIVDRGGHALAPTYVANACPKLVASAQATAGGTPAAGHVSRAPTPAGVQVELQSCFARVGARFHEVVTYQPGSRYWTFQWYELAIFLGGALTLVGFSTLWVRHRLR
jgi:hypothetical protein